MNARRSSLRAAGLVLSRALAFAALGLALFWVFHVTSANLAARGVRTGLGFLAEPARTAVANTPFAFEPGVDSNALALAAGAVNTLKISLLAIVFSTALGLVIGVGRLSRNRLVRTVCVTYVEAVRNVPVLIHISIWYGLALALPAPREAGLTLGTVLATNRGVFFTFFARDPLWLWSLGLCALAAAGLLVLRRSGHRPGLTASLPVLAAAVAAPWIAAGQMPRLEQPMLSGFRIAAPLYVSPELGAFVAALSIYTASFVAEIVRGAIQAVPRGQWEASAALALSEGETRRSVIFPQAVRVAIPALGNEYIGVVKNSSLAVVIGFQEIVGVGNTVLFDTGQAVEIMAVLAAFFIAVSLAISGAMNVLNSRSAWATR